MMSFRAATAAGALLVASSLPSCRPASTGSYDRSRAEAEIRDIEKQWAQVAVTGDPAVIDRLFARDFLGITPEGARYTKQEFVEDTKAHPLGFKSNQVDHMTVRFYGDVAVAQGAETFTTGAGSSGRFVWTDVLVRQDTGWEIVAAQDVVAPVTGAGPLAPLFQAPDRADSATRGIGRTRAAYATAWSASDAKRVTALYAEDAVVLYPNQPAVTGRAAIGAYFAEFFTAFPRNEFELNSTELLVMGQWAFDRGTYRWKGYPRAGGQPLEDQGKYLVVLRLAPDGSWQVARDMDNSDRPATQGTRGT